MTTTTFTVTMKRCFVPSIEHSDTKDNQSFKISQILQIYSCKKCQSSLFEQLGVFGPLDFVLCVVRS